MMNLEGSGSGSISQRHGSADPDPHQNVMDPEHWFLGKLPEYSTVPVTVSVTWLLLKPLVVQAIVFKLFTVHSSSVYFACTFSPFCTLEI
jgi:hypothetical protein